MCDDAGVTRGALTHHYPNLGGLLAAALVRPHDEMLPAGTQPADTVRGALDRAWAAVSDRRFKAVMEAWWAAGNDPELGQSIGPIVASFAEVASPAKSPSPIFRQVEVTTFLLTAREALLGLAMGRATSGGRSLGHERKVLAALRATADAHDHRLTASKGQPT